MDIKELLKKGFNDAYFVSSYRGTYTINEVRILHLFYMYLLDRYIFMNIPLY